MGGRGRLRNLSDVTTVTNEEVLAGFEHRERGCYSFSVGSNERERIVQEGKNFCSRKSSRCRNPELSPLF